MLNLFGILDLEFEISAGLPAAVYCRPPSSAGMIEPGLFMGSRHEAA